MNQRWYRVCFTPSVRMDRGRFCLEVNMEDKELVMDEKEIEIGGCILVPRNVSKDEVIDQFIEWVESKGWYFGGGFRELTYNEKGELIP